MNTSLTDPGLRAGKLGDEPQSPSRRNLLMGLAALPVLSMAGPLGASEQFWNQPRKLHLYRPALKKTLNVVYWHAGRVYTPGYRQLCLLLKDHRQDEAVSIDPRLFDLLCAMQAWVGYYGYKDPIQVNSGYRTARTNNRLEGAARNSMHLYGKAADIVFPGLPASYINQLAQRYAGGGVGFYPSSGFVHVDTGRQRVWRGR